MMNSQTVILDQDARNFATVGAGLQSMRVHGRAETEQDAEEESDMREVIRVLQEQVQAKCDELAKLKEAHQNDLDKVHLEHAQTKIKLAQVKQSLQDYEDFIAINKKQIEQLELMNKDKDNELVALKVDIATAKAQMNFLV